MAEDNEQANLVVSAVNEATATLQDIQKSFEDFEGSADKLGITSVALGGILKDILMKAFEELKEVVKLGMDEAIEAEHIQMKLANSFKAEGEAAGKSVKSINDTANSLGELIGVDNDVIAASATTIRQMTGLSSEIINKLLPAVGDLAVKTGDYESAATMVARAVNGHARGLQMLGIEYKATGDKEKDVIELTKKINEQFGGLAQENMTTTAGKLQNLKVTFTDVAQEIGSAVINSGLFNDALTVTKNSLQLIKGILSGNADENKKVSNSLATVTQQYNELYLGVKQTSVILSTDALNALTKVAEKQKEVAKTTKDLSDEELQTIADNLQLEVDATKEALKNIDDLNKRADEARYAKGNPIFEPMTKEQVSMVQATEDMIYSSGENLKTYFATIDEVIGNDIRIIIDMSLAAIGYFNNLLPTLYANMLNTTKSGLEKMKDFWQGFVMTVLAELNRILIKLIIIKAATAVFNAVSGVGPVADVMTSLMGFQTPDEGSRLIPGPPNMPRLEIVHGGETVSRGGEGGGGFTLQVAGDYFESDEANARIYDRLYRYNKRNGLSLA
jgi:hypothetical protein